jgi:hypothetical protein
MRVIEQRLDTPGSLRHGRSVTSDESGITFVSAELVRAVDDPRDRGDLLTWAKAKVGGGFVAVDEDARKNSSWPNASFDVRQAGAIESRACAAVRRGKTTECDGPGAGLAQQGGQGAGCTERSR